MSVAAPAFSERSPRSASRNAALVQTYNPQDDAVRNYHRQNLAIAAAEPVGAHAAGYL